VSTVRTQSGQRKVHPSVERKFFGNDSESSGALMSALAFVLTADGLLQYAVIHVLHVVSKNFRLDCYHIFLGIGVLPTITLG
jgi:hypothetical protein